MIYFFSAKDYNSLGIMLSCLILIKKKEDT